VFVRAFVRGWDRNGSPKLDAGKTEHKAKMLRAKIIVSRQLLALKNRKGECCAFVIRRRAMSIKRKGKIENVLVAVMPWYYGNIAYL